MDKEFCESMLKMVNDTIEAHGITAVTKIEQDRTYHTIDVDSVRFNTSNGVTISITVTSPKIRHLNHL